MKEILLINMHPSDTELPYLDIEEKELVESLTKSDQREDYRIISKGAVSLRELHAYLEEYKPAILHISGHNCVDGQFHFEQGEHDRTEVTLENFCESIKNYHSHLRCVFLNVCFSIAGVVEIDLHENQTIIGMSSAVNRNTAILFSSSFYASLFGGKSVLNSFQSAAGVVNLEGLGDEVVPVMIGSTDLDHTVLPEEETVEDVSWNSLDIVSEDNLKYAMEKRKKQKKSFYAILGLVILISFGLVVGSYTATSGETGWYSLIGILPLGILKWLKDRMDTIDDSLTLLSMLQSEINRFASLFENPPVERVHERAAQYNEQFWRILESK